MAILHVVPINLGIIDIVHYHGGLYDIGNESMTLDHALHFLANMVREDILGACYSDCTPDIVFEELHDARYLCLTVSFPEMPNRSKNYYHVYLYNDAVGYSMYWTKSNECLLDILNKTNKKYECRIYDMIHSTYYVKHENATDPYDLCAKVSGYFYDDPKPSVKESSNTIVFYDEDYNPVAIVGFSEE